MRWTYVDDYGRHHNVGLFHGMRTGHLMIYCNTKVLFIDFNVVDSKTYSFFINDELLDVQVENNDGRFAYGLEIDQKTNTPRNIRRRKLNRSDLLKSLLVMSLVIGMIVLISLLMIT